MLNKIQRHLKQQPRSPSSQFDPNAYPNETIMTLVSVSSLSNDFARRLHSYSERTSLDTPNFSVNDEALAT